MKNNIDLSKFVDVGGILKKRRLELNLSLASIAKKLKISDAILEKIEEGDVLDLIGKIYYQGVVMKYSQSIGLKYEKILDYIAKDIEKFNMVNAKKILTIGEGKRKIMSKISLQIFCTIGIIITIIVALNTILTKKYDQDASLFAIKSQGGY